MKRTNIKGRRARDAGQGQETKEIKSKRNKRDERIKNNGTKEKNTKQNRKQ